MPKLRIERIGGLAGFGGKSSHLRSAGEINLDELSEEERETVNDLFTTERKSGKDITNDGFRYKISKETTNGIVNIELDEDMVPDILKKCLRDEII